MRCVECGKNLGHKAAVAKGKDVCKRCRIRFEAKAHMEHGLLTTSPTTKVSKRKAIKVYFLA